jgi:L-amino acid N-acyltransferase YncA
MASRHRLDLEDLKTRSSIVSRGVVRRSQRGKGLFVALYDAYDDASLAEGIAFSIAAIEPTNSISRRVLIDRGYETFGLRTNERGWTGEYFCKPLSREGRPAGAL